MFNGLTAWFSSSVNHRVIQDWEIEGGIVRDIDEAQFIFSNNSETDDTKSLYKSEAYLDEHLAIFHSQYITDCIKHGGTRDIVLGKYFLPPLPVQTLMAREMKFLWKDNSADKTQTKKIKEKSNEKSRVGNSSPAKTTQTTANSQSQTRTRSTVRVLSRQTDNTVIPHIDNLPRVHGCIQDFIPGQNGCEVFMIS